MRRSLESVKVSLKDLLNRGYNGGFLVIDIGRSKRFLQFSKYITNTDYGIELGFPITEWSQDFEEPLKSLSRKMNLGFTEQQLEEMKFINIDFKKDLDLTHNFVKRIVTEVFNSPPDIDLYIHLEHASTDFDAVIVDKDAG